MTLQAKSWRHTMVASTLLAIACLTMSATDKIEAQKMPTDIPKLQKAIQQDPDDTASRFALAVALMDKHRYAEAVSQWEIVMPLIPDNSQIPSDLGLAYYHLNKLVLATSMYRKSLAINNKSYVTHARLGHVLFLQKNIEEGSKEFEEAIRLDPHDAMPHEVFAIDLSESGVTDRGIDEYRTAIQLDPKNIRTYLLLAYTYNAAGHLTDAIQVSRQATLLEPKNARPHEDLGRYLYFQGDLEKSLREMRIAVALAPDDTLAHSDLGFILLRRGNLNAAQREFKRAIALDPNNIDAHGKFGELLAQRGQLQQALQETQLAVKMVPDDASSHASLGFVLYKSGHKAQARKEWNYALTLYDVYGKIEAQQYLKRYR